MSSCVDPRVLPPILVSAQAGDRQAQAKLAELLMNELRAPLVAMAMRVVPEHERDDVLQDTFIRLVWSDRKFDPAHPSANPTAFCVDAARTAADAGGRARRAARTAALDPADLDGIPSDAAFQRKAEATAQVEAREQLAVVCELNPILFRVAAAVASGEAAKVAGRWFDMSPSKVCRALQSYAAECREVCAAA